MREEEGAPLPELRWASSNLEKGGRKDGHSGPLTRTLDVVAGLDPHVWCVQELGHENPDLFMEHMLLIASQLAMQPFTGPVCGLAGAHGNRVAIFVSKDYEVRDLWPGLTGRQTLPWMRARITGPGLPQNTHVFSAHLAARSADERRHDAQVIGSWSADQMALGHTILLAGDLNYQAPGGAGMCPLSKWPRRLLPQRARPVPEGTEGATEIDGEWWVPDTAPGGELTLHGLHDVAHLVATRTGSSTPYLPTGIPGQARVDQLWIGGELADATLTYSTHLAGSDHMTLAATIQLPG
jgi:endonuclease/exonuclease/phosphatase family metal-dependent hydrolase